MWKLSKFNSLLIVTELQSYLYSDISAYNTCVYYINNLRFILHYNEVGTPTYPHLKHAGKWLYSSFFLKHAGLTMGGGLPPVGQKLNYGPYYGWGGGDAPIWNVTTEIGRGHLLNECWPPPVLPWLVGLNSVYHRKLKLGSPNATLIK